MNIHEDLQALAQSNDKLAEAMVALAQTVAQAAELLAAAGAVTAAPKAKSETQPELPLDEPTKPARTSKTRAAKAAKAAEVEEPDPLDEEDETPEEPVITRADLAAVLSKLPRDGILKLLEKHGAATLKEVDEDAYPALLKAAQAAVDALEE